MRARCPIANVPQLNAILMTRRDDIYTYEKKIDIFSSDQPDGLMQQLMGQNMMRKDGAAHQLERQAMFPSISPKTVAQIWQQRFIDDTSAVLDALQPKGRADLVAEFAMPVSAMALITVTGLASLHWSEIDAASQAMIDGCANYQADQAIEARCRHWTDKLDDQIHRGLTSDFDADDVSIMAAQHRAGLTPEQICANIKLAISGGQNEPRDAIAGTAWAVLTHPEIFHQIRHGVLTWRQVFEEFARWHAPIGMSPRRVSKDCTVEGVSLSAGERMFFMFGSANRDEKAFARPDRFDPYQDISKAITFGAGPHFCAGAWIARTLIAEVALPLLFDRMPQMVLAGPTNLRGWAFRGPDRVDVTWS